APAAESVAAFVQPSASEDALVGQALRLPALPPFALDIDIASPPPDLCEAFVAAPAAESDAAFVQPSSSEDAMVGQAFSLPALPPLALGIDTAFAPPDLCEAFVAAPAAESAAAFVQPSSSEDAMVGQAFSLPALPQLALGIDTAFAPPGLCEA